MHCWQQRSASDDRGCEMGGQPVAELTEKTTGWSVLPESAQPPVPEPEDVWQPPQCVYSTFCGDEASWQMAPWSIR